MKLSHAQRETLACIADEPTPLEDFETHEERHTLGRLQSLGLVSLNGCLVYATELGRSISREITG